MTERWWNLPLEDEDDDLHDLDSPGLYDWKPKHEVIPKPGRREGDQHPDLKASIEKTRDDFGMVDQRPPSPRARLEKLLAGVPQPRADHIRELLFYREHRELAEFLERSEARHTAALASAKG